MNIIALIPARSGSKRIPQKNIRPLAYQPLIAYTIQAALKSKIFSWILVSTDCPMTEKISYAYGADMVVNRPAEISGDLSHDFEWVKHALDEFNNTVHKYRGGRFRGKPFSGFDCFAMLRPTSPFRTAETIIRAWEQFQKSQPCDSLRAVQKVREHPKKMWRIFKGLDGDPDTMIQWGDGDGDSDDFRDDGIPWCDLPYQALPEVYVQNGCIQIAHTSLINKYHNVTGWEVVPFLTEGYEGFDINTREDIWLAESIINGHIASPADIMLGYREGGKDKGISHQELMDMLRRAGFDETN